MQPSEANIMCEMPAEGAISQQILAACSNKFFERMKI